MLNDPREYQTVEYDGQRMRVCTWCGYPTPDPTDRLYPDHATWCEGQAMRDAALASQQPTPGSEG